MLLARHCPSILLLSHNAVDQRAKLDETVTEPNFAIPARLANMSTMIISLPDALKEFVTQQASTRVTAPPASMCVN